MVVNYWPGKRSGSTSRPLYVPQVGQTRCACFGEPHCGQVERRGASIACVARRLSRRDLEVFLFGTAIGGPVYRSLREVVAEGLEGGPAGVAVLLLVRVR